MSRLKSKSEMSHSGAGILLVDKPEGPSSHDVVAAARRALKTRRIGHTGTLDPFASGLLVLCIGWATRLAEYLTGLPKKYRGVLRLGEVTDTADRTGEVVSRSDRWRELGPDEIDAAFRTQLGEILQVPPAYSAKKIEGRRAYDRARRGEVVDLQPVPVEITRIEVLEIALPDVAFEVECSSGTYIRSIARDVGQVLGTGGHLLELRRLRVGSMDVEDAVPMSALDDAAAVQRSWRPPLAAVAELPQVAVEEPAALSLSRGMAIPAPAELPVGEPIAVSFRGELLAIGEVLDRRLKPKKVFSRD